MAAVNPPSIGSKVAVPGEMYGTVKFIGAVLGKKGTFAGVQLAPEYSTRGKNSGDVDGQYYFRTTVQGSGIFLPLEKAIPIDEPAAPAPKRGLMGAPATPRASNALGAFNQGGRTPSAAMNLGALPKPNFSQSMGPGMRPTSPVGKGGKRESLPRPTSPLRRPQNNGGAATPKPVKAAVNTPKTRPSIGFARSTMAAGGPAVTPRYGAASPAPRMGGPVGGNKFTQSLRQARTPSAASNRQMTPLGPEASFDEEPEETGMNSQGTSTPTPAAYNAESERYETEIRRLKTSLDDRDRQLKEQGSSIVDMEKSLTELQKLLPMGPDSPGRERRSRESPRPDDDLPTDVQSLRQALREKNDKIKALTAEFDTNRADFRSTIDTLEMASSETERVYEKRVDELLEELRTIQDRGQDVEEVTTQFRQLEELVQELEEGLEDARRGESEARAENEFLRGEVERLRSEMKRGRDDGGGEGGWREAERKLTGEDDETPDGESENAEMARKLDQRNSEIRGLKAMIAEMNKNGNGTNTAATTNGDLSFSHRASQQLELQIRDLKALLSQKSDRAEELENEVSRLRKNSYGRFPAASTSNRDSADTLKHRSVGNSTSRPVSDRTVVPNTAGNGGSQPWHDANSTPTSPIRQLHSQAHHSRSNTATKVLSMVHEDHDTALNSSPTHYEKDLEADEAISQSGTTDASSTALWCEICEENGHDILTCTNMNMFDKTPVNSKAESHSRGPSHDASARPAPLKTGSWRSNADSKSNANTTPRPSISAAVAAPPGPAPASTLPAPPIASSFSTNHSQHHPDASTSVSPPSTTKTVGSATTSTHTDNNTNGESNAEASKPTINQAGMVAGKSSGVIDEDRWCALCERDGHESVDCPFEDAF